MEKTRIWLDTDIGDDIDDTLVLEEILRNPALELVGVSTVFKNTPLRAEFARRMLRAAGREDVPVLAGSPTPIRGLTPVRPHETFSQWDLEEKTPDPGIYGEQAKDPHLVPRRILEEARKAPLVLLAIAPLTNIARTILEDKEGVLRNSRLFLMGGEYREHRPEWNLECDVEAFRILLSSGLDVHAVGLELTEKSTLSPAEEELLGRTGEDALADFRREAVRRFQRSTGWPITPHDALALYMLLKEEKLSFLPVRHEVEEGTIDGQVRGWLKEGKEVPGIKFLASIDMEDLRRFVLRLGI